MSGKLLRIEPGALGVRLHDAATLRSVSLVDCMRSPLAIGRNTGPSVMAPASSHAFSGEFLNHVNQL
jgi:hypothetical protein